MNKLISVTLVFLLVAMSLHAVSAISTDMKESYLSGETIITEVYGNILQPITASNVEFRRGHILVPLDYGIGKLGDRYFLWANAPLTAGNYTLIIGNIATTVAGQMKEIDYVKNFSVEENLSDYSVKPGIISTETGFEIKIQLNLDNSLEIGAGLLEGENNTKLIKPGENILKVGISEISETGLYNLTIGRYVIPAYIRINRTEKIGNALGANLSNLTSVSESNLSSEEKGAIEKERTKYYCYEFPGINCKADETCSGQTITSLDGACCVNGECSSSGGGGSMAWIGWLLAAVVIILVAYIWIRYKKVKADKNPLEKKILSLEKKIP